jgi:hypothetical protein
MLSEHELKAVSDALTHLQKLVGSSFDGMKYEIDQIKKEINLLKYNVDQTFQDNRKANQNIKQLSIKIDKLENENGN